MVGGEVFEVADCFEVVEVVVWCEDDAVEVGGEGLVGVEGGENWLFDGVFDGSEVVVVVKCRSDDDGVCTCHYGVDDVAEDAWSGVKPDVVVGGEALEEAEVGFVFVDAVMVVEIQFCGCG